MVKADKIAGFLLLAIFSIALYMALDFPYEASYYVILINILGIFLSICLIISAYMRGKKGDATQVPKISKDTVKKIIIVTISITLYAIVMRTLGYILSTIVFFSGIILYLYNGKNYKKMAIVAIIIAIVTALIIYYIFGKILYIPLPKGKIL